MTKLKIVSIFTLALLLLAPNSVFSKNIKTVQVISESRASSKPDIAHIVMHFTGYGWKVEGAQKKVNKIIKKFMDKLKENNIETLDIDIADIKLKPSYQYNRDLKTNVPSDFLVSRQVTLTLENINEVSKVMDISLSLGSFFLESARLSVRNKNSLQDKALKKTLKRSRKKAENIAGMLDKKVIEAISVNEMESRMEDVDLIHDSKLADRSSPGISKSSKDNKSKSSKNKSIDPDLLKNLEDTTRVHAYSKLQVTYQTN